MKCIYDGTISSREKFTDWPASAMVAGDATWIAIAVEELPAGGTNPFPAGIGRGSAARQGVAIRIAIVMAAINIIGGRIITRLSFIFFIINN